MPCSSVTYEVREDTAYLTLNRPRVLNAMNLALLEELAEAVGRLRLDREVAFLVLRGAGGNFSAGADLRQLAESGPEDVRRIADLAAATINAIERLPIVTIAAIEGYAVGGGLELAEACSLRVCAQTSRLGHPEVRVGAVAGFGGTTRLIRTVGRARATEMLLTGRLFSAREAQDWGIVTVVSPPGFVDASVERLIQDLRCSPPHALRYSLLAIEAAADASMDAGTTAGAAFFGMAASDPEFRRAIRAFLNRPSQGLASS